jgi:predicted RNase H-like nuclease (RuvC/YqgF family)
MESSGYFFDTDKNKRKEKNFLTLFILLTIVLTIACVILAWQLIEFRNLAKQESTAKTEALTAKDDLLHKLKNLELEYDELSKEYEGLDSVFTKEKAKITELMDEIKELKGSPEVYQAKVAELEKRLKEYVDKIEALKSKNEILSSDNLKIKNTLDSTLNINVAISSKNLTLTEKVKAQAILKATDLVTEGIRFTGKKQEVPTRSAKKAQRLKTCFSLSENMLATKGYKVIYLRIADPDGTIFCLSENDTFTFKGKSIIYSARKEVYYDNSNQDICIYWEKLKDFKKGTYYVDIFSDDNLLGTSTLLLE